MSSCEPEPSPPPHGCDNWGRLTFLLLSEPRPATTMLTLFPVLGYCYPMTVPRNTVTEHGINTHG